MIIVADLNPSDIASRNLVSSSLISTQPITITETAISSPMVTPAYAIDKAREMIEGSFNNVIIATQDGRVYREADFGLLITSAFAISPGGIVTPLWACGPAGGSVAKGMKKISYRGYRFPPEIIQQAIWLYLRFTLSLRDVEDLLAERGIMVSYETVRRWVNHFGPMIAADLRKRRPKPHNDLAFG